MVQLRCHHYFWPVCLENENRIVHPECARGAEKRCFKVGSLLPVLHTKSQGMCIHPNFETIGIGNQYLCRTQSGVIIIIITITSSNKYFKKKVLHENKKVST